MAGWGKEVRTGVSATLAGAPGAGLRGLDRVPEPAWIVRIASPPQVEAANQRARERQEFDAEVLDAVFEALAKGREVPHPFDATLVARHGDARWYLVIEAETPADRLLRLRRRFEFTDRQAEVADLLLDGRSNKEIADALKTSVRTVEVHVSALLRRCGAASRGEFIAQFWRPPA